MSTAFANSAYLLIVRSYYYAEGDYTTINRFGFISSTIKFCLDMGIIVIFIDSAWRLQNHRMREAQGNIELTMPEVIMRSVAIGLVILTLYCTITLYLDRYVKLAGLHTEKYYYFRWVNVYLVYKVAHFLYAVSFLFLLKRLSKVIEAESKQSFSYLLKTSQSVKIINPMINEPSTHLPHDTFNPTTSSMLKKMSSLEESDLHGTVAACYLRQMLHTSEKSDDTSFLL